MTACLNDCRTPPSVAWRDLAAMRSEHGQETTLDVAQPLSDLHQRLKAQPTAVGVLLTDQGRSAGAICRTALYARLSQPFVRELFFDKPIARFLAKFPMSVMEVDGAIAIADAVRRALDRPMEQRYDPIVVSTVEGRFLLDVHAVLSGQCELLRTALAELERQRQAKEAAEAERERLHERLMSASREAGKAEIATSILHNVGNVLNSVNVSATVVSSALRQSKVPNLAKAAAMLEEQSTDLPRFLVEDERGQRLPGYLNKLAGLLSGEQATMLEEMESLGRSLEHLSHIISTQQSHAKGALALEPYDLVRVMDEVIRMSEGSIQRHRIEVVREIPDAVPIVGDRHLMMQVLVNLLTNARRAVKHAEGPEKRITIRIEPVDTNGEARVQIEVIDTGVGIAPEIMEKIFTYGFTTHAEGHGYGLHNAANVIGQMHGTLTVHSDGPGRGATFRIDVPAELTAADIPNE